MKIIPLFILLPIILAACSPSAPSAPGAPNAPNAPGASAPNAPVASAPGAPSLTPSPSDDLYRQPPSSPTPTPLPPSTSTLRPSRTPTKTSTPRPTRTVTQTATPTLDWIVVEKTLAHAVMTATPPAVAETHVSPDGIWRAETIRYGCVGAGAGDGAKNAYDQLRLVQIDTGVETLVADQLQYCEGVGAYGLGFAFWSPNSQYLYYTTSAFGVPDGGGIAWYPSLIRYDLLSGETVDLRWGPLTPDGVTLAYPDPQDLAVVIWDLDKGEIARIPSSLPAGSWEAGVYDLTWSPDGKSLAYFETENQYVPVGKSWLVLLDLSTLERQVIYQIESGQLCCIKWQLPGQIQFQLDSQTQTLTLP